MKALILAFAFKQCYHVLRATKAAGYSVHVLGRGYAHGLKDVRFCSSFQHFDFDPSTQSLETALEEIKRAIAHVSADVILPSDVVSTRLLAALQERLPIPAYPLPAPSVFDMMNNKWSFYHFCKEHDVPVPDTMLFDDGKSIKQALAQGTLTFPIIIKPLDSLGQTGIRPIMNESEMHILDNVDYTPILAQSFITGGLLCVDILADQGRIVAYAIQRNRSDRYEYIKHDKLLAHAVQIIRASGFNGAALFDVMEDEKTGDVYFLECNPRFWYSIFAATLAGINFIKAGLEMKSLDLAKPLSIANVEVSRVKAGIMNLLSLSGLNDGDRRILKYLVDDPVGSLYEKLPMFDDSRDRGPGSIDSQIAAITALRVGVTGDQATR